MATQKLSTTPVRTNQVQSLARSFEVLELLADMGGHATLSVLSTMSTLPQPTIHRLLQTLVDLGYVQRDSSRRYALGPRLIRLGESATRLLGSHALPHLTRLVDTIGETANLAVLDGASVVYIAQVPSRHSMRMFTEVGRRVLPHCTGVGKVLLAQLSEDEVRAILNQTGMPPQTIRTIKTPRKLLEQLARVREAGYAIDDGEQEVGVRCVAVYVPTQQTRAAISVSGPAARISDELVGKAVPILQEAAAALAADLG
jgi:IclR family acetate operon transcriptional repressor